MVKCSAAECDRDAKAKGLCPKHYSRLYRRGTLATTRYTGDFWSKVAKGTPEECWPWLGYRRDSGHGLTTYKGRMTHASRKAWILTKGPIPGDQCVNHRCDNPVCCNPDHMYLGSRADNMYDYFGNVPAWERTSGRKFSPTDEQLERMWNMRKAGATYREVAAAIGMHHTTVARYVTEIRRGKARQLAKLRLSGNQTSRA